VQGCEERDRKEGDRGIGERGAYMLTCHRVSSTSPKPSNGPDMNGFESRVIQDCDFAV
jgi:hypothetical protein